MQKTITPISIPSTDMTIGEDGLKKCVKPVHLWAIAVGTVFSGDFYGYSYGFLAGGPVSFLISLIPVTIMYAAFLFCYIELACSIPQAGGPSAYARRATGPFTGFIAGISVLLVDIFALCAVSMCSGSILNYLIPALPAAWYSLGFFLLMVLVSLGGMESSKKFILIMTIIGLAAIVLYAVIAVPHFEASHFFTDPPLTNGFAGIAGAATFSMWFFFGIESAAMQSEEIEDPKRDIPKGYIPVIITLLATGLIVTFLTAGIADYKILAQDNYPLTKALELALGAGSIWPKLFAVFVLVSLVTSLSGFILTCSRQVYAMGREGYLPKIFTKLSNNGTPLMGVFVPAAVVILLILTTNVDKLIIMGVFAAMIMYALCITAVFVLRRREPEMERPFKVPYPVVPVIAAVFLIFILACSITYNFSLLKWIILLYGIASIYYLAVVKKHMNSCKTQLP